MKPKPGARKLKKNHPYGWLKAHDMEAFEIFFATRNFAEVARQLSVTKEGVGKHAEKHNWIDRLAKRLTKLDEQVTDKLSDRLARDAHRQYNIMSLVEVNAQNLLKKPDLAAGGHVKAHEIVMSAGAVETAIKGKRLLAGETTEKVELTFKDVILKLHEAAGRKI